MTRKPMIGITSHMDENGTHHMSQDNLRRIANENGIPIILPNVPDEASIPRIISSIDGLVVTGGGDIDPTLFGEEPHLKLGSIHPDRDAFEMMLIQAALEANLPILAICRGCQILNIAAGGDMYQDIYSQYDVDLLQHQQRAPRQHVSHFIDVDEGTLLQRISKSSRYKVNSFHHQAVRRLAQGFRRSAVSSDNIIEAFESERHSFVIGVQWHPENLFDDEYANRLYKTFIAST